MLLRRNPLGENQLVVEVIQDQGVSLLVFFAFEWTDLILRFLGNAKMERKVDDVG